MTAQVILTFDLLDNPKSNDYTWLYEQLNNLGFNQTLDMDHDSFLNHDTFVSILGANTKELPNTTLVKSIELESYESSIEHLKITRTALDNTFQRLNGKYRYYLFVSEGEFSSCISES
ncbi:hypothetical protein [Vibrio harveyi]|uniref:hypothetical protein n=1 Tax=Vibrio harveyi TaxID=669 RepID=UPI003D711558